MNTTRLLWQDAGSPRINGHTPQPEDRCFLCGHSCDIGCIATKKAFGTSFTDWDAAKCNSDVVCTPCAWSMSGKPPDTFRMLSVVYRTDIDLSHRAIPGTRRAIGPHTWVGNKKDLRMVLDTLLSPPGGVWFASVADSGKVHTVPFATINKGGSWTIRFERSDVQ